MGFLGLVCRPQVAEHTCFIEHSFGPGLLLFGKGAVLGLVLLYSREAGLNLGGMLVGAGFGIAGCFNFGQVLPVGTYGAGDLVSLMLHLGHIDTLDQIRSTSIPFR